MVDVPNRPGNQTELFKKALTVRHEEPGGDCVGTSLARADYFNAVFQPRTTEIATEVFEEIDATKE